MRRIADTAFCTIFRAVDGGWQSHSAFSMRLLGTTWFACRRR
jgi:hypothetical protein